MTAWEPVDSTDPDTLRAVIAGRFHVFTWPFGDIHQAKVIVEYEHAKTGSYMNVPGPAVGIGLQPGTTRREAQARGEAWVERYLQEGPRNPEDVIEQSLKDWPTIHKDRADVLEQMLFTCGGGYRWLDGALIDTDQAPPPDFSHLDAQVAELDALGEETRRLLKEAGHEVPEEPPPEPEPPKTFKARSGANIFEVPRDVRRDWLKVVREAAQLLLERPSDKETEAEGHRLLRALQWR